MVAKLNYDVIIIVGLASSDAFVKHIVNYIYTNIHTDVHTQAHARTQLNAKENFNTSTIKRHKRTNYVQIEMFFFFIDKMYSYYDNSTTFTNLHIKKL